MCVCVCVCVLVTTTQVEHFQHLRRCPGPLPSPCQLPEVTSVCFPSHWIGLACCWISYEWSHWLCILLCLASLARHNMWDSSKFACILVFFLCGYTTVGVSVFLLMIIWFVSRLGCYKAAMNVLICIIREHKHSFLLNIYLEWNWS